jgi:hypothetical protein
MGVERGAANLRRFNAERSAHLMPLLTHELQLCKKRKLEFKSVGLLAAYLSDRLKVHRTTFLRNLSYRTVLLEHLSLQPGVVSRSPDTTMDPAVLQAKLASARLEASNLRQELREANARLARFENPVSSPLASKSELDFANLAMLVVNLITRLDDMIAIDFADRTIVDLSARPSERVVAGPDRAAAFISWVEQNQAVPMVHTLKTNDRDFK